jgi:hypothetical protein
VAEDTPAPGPSSTPSAKPAEGVEPVKKLDTLYPEKVAEPQKVPEAAKPEESVPKPAEAKPAEAKPPEPKPDEPLFKLPEDFKPSDTAVAKFTEYAKKLPPGMAQSAADVYVEMARDAASAWDAQIKAVNAANEAACKATFTGEELAAAETAVGWFSRFDPKFREVAKRQLNDPTFVNAMRLVGMSLSEDTLGKPSAPPPPVDKRSLHERAAAALYGGKRPS